ncbi:hypothetical protein CBF17_023095, partial [Pantoea agglomerans]|uniref:hypothetical protein n=1 Tax=Enterobacter agglomerans TaxID=549 RepID=UPI000C081882
MNNQLVCLEGTLQFNEEVKTQCISIIAFRTGQQITINRNRLTAGCTLIEEISQQISNASKILNQYNLIKMEEINDGSLFTETVQVISTFVPGPGSSNLLWQVSYACLISNDEIMSFSSIYPDESAMKNEMGRLHH